MAKSKRRSTYRSASGGSRNVYRPSITSPKLFRSKYIKRVTHPPIRPRPPSRLNRVEDNRRFDPTRSLARHTTGVRARLKSPSQMKWRLQVPYWIDFANPYRVITCVRRKVRREVLHALHMPGGLGLQKRKPTSRRNSRSEIHC